MKIIKKILFVLIVFTAMFVETNNIVAKTINDVCGYRLIDPWNNNRQYDIKYSFSYDSNNSDNVNSYQLTGMFAKPTNKNEYTEYDKNTYPTIKLDEIVNLILVFPDEYFFDHYIRRGQVCPNICLHRNDDEYMIISEEEPGTCSGPNNKSISAVDFIPDRSSSKSYYGSSTGGYSSAGRSSSGSAGAHSSSSGSKKSSVSSSVSGMPTGSHNSSTGSQSSGYDTPDGYKYRSCSLKIGNDDKAYMNRKIKLIFNYYKGNDIKKYKTTWFQGKANVAGWNKVASDAAINGISFSDQEYDGLKLRVEKSVLDMVYTEINNNYDNYKSYDVEETAKSCNVDKTKIYVCNTLSDQHGITIITITADESRLEGECTGGIIDGDAEEIIEDDPDASSASFKYPDIGGDTGFGDAANCKKVFGEAGYNIINGLIKVLRILAPIVAIVIAMITLIPAVTAKDESKVKAATKKCVTIGIVLLIIEVIPYLIRLVGVILDFDLSCIG